MCGVVAYTGEDNATDIIYEGLLRLEYRGYDSAGIAVADGADLLSVAKNVGKIRHLRPMAQALPLAHLGIGHTRWATHGPPSDENAHPHTSMDGKIAIVHNGIIENYLEIKEELQGQGYVFKSETDSEVLAHLIQDAYEGDLKEAVLVALRRVEGAFAIAAIHRDHPRTVVGSRRLSPLVVGFGKGENFLASDVLAILSYTKEVHYLDDDQVVEITPDKVSVFTLEGKPAPEKRTVVDWNPVLAERGGFDHFMLKEIFEQPEVIRNTVGGRIDKRKAEVRLGELGLDEEKVRKLERVYLTACGTAYYSGLVGKYMIESIARVPCEVVLASEFRYADPILNERSLVVGISQSGETTDTLGALRKAKEEGVRTLAVCNVKGSTITREVDATLYIHAGPEIGVASTKAYMAMLVAMNLLAIHLGKLRGTLPDERARKLLDALRNMDEMVAKFLKDNKVEPIARQYAKASNFLYLGRYINFPTALEGALKLKEISYIHAEGYAAGEMKHGPIALVDEHMPTMAIVTEGRTYEKVLSNIKEVKARGGKVIAVATEGDSSIHKYADDVIFVPRVDELLSPLVNIVPLQLLAYHIANLRGADVDQPRNLAKSVTVE